MCCAPCCCSCYEDEADEANDVADKLYEADKSKANEADKVKANEANKAIVADEADMVMGKTRPQWHPNKADVANEAEDELVVANVAVDELDELMVANVAIDELDELVVVDVADDTNEANGADAADRTNEAIGASAANKAIVSIAL
jgi:hypothetical protein